MKRKDKFWEYAEDKNGCFSCKIKSHLSKLTGRDIAVCEKVTEDVQAAALLAIGTGKENGTKKRRTEPFSTSNGDGVIDLDTGTDLSASKLRQATITGLCSIKNKDALDQLVAIFFFLNNIAFNVVQSQSFINLMKGVAAYGAGYIVPCYTTLRTKLLANERAHVDDYAKEIKESWKISGCTIVSDIWTCKKTRAYINVVACSPKGAVFLRSFEDEDDVGPQNVVQVITDNASNYKCAGDMVMNMFPHIYKVKCAAHGIQLLLKDIYEQVLWVKKVYDNAKSFVDYINDHIIILAMVREATGGRKIRKPNKTRFASKFLMLQSFLNIEDDLRSLVASPEWRNMDYNKRGVGKSTNAAEVISTFEPIVRVLRLVDGDGSTAGYIYESMMRAQETLRRKVETDPDRFSMIWGLFEIRRDSNIVDKVHAAAAYLNPKLMYDGVVSYTQVDVSQGLLFLGEKMLDVEERDAFVAELLTYQRKHSKIFNVLSISQLRSAHPRVWREVNGGFVPLLRKIAIRVLSQPCSSSSCERNWSAFEAAQTKKRCKLLPETLEDLVYIRMNSLMMLKSDEVEQQDRVTINLEALGDFPEDIDDGRDDEDEDGENNVEGGVETDQSWLGRRLFMGSSSSNLDLA
ncbi:hypothetical protein ACHQM5_008112 [Ranunculus cassubicifolius]